MRLMHMESSLLKQSVLHTRLYLQTRMARTGRRHINYRQIQESW